MEPEAVVREFWRLMATNDFHAVKAVLAPDFLLEWPQSNERIRGGEDFARMNAEYPAHGRSEFRINRLIAGLAGVVTQVSVTDGTQRAEPISFFTVRDGRITHLVEYWPEPFAPAENRRQYFRTSGPSAVRCQASIGGVSPAVSASGSRVLETIQAVTAPRPPRLGNRERDARFDSA